MSDFGSKKPFFAIPIDLRPIQEIVVEIARRSQNPSEIVRLFFISTISLTHAKKGRIHRRSLQFAEYPIGVGRAMSFISKIISMGASTADDKAPIYIHDIGGFIKELFDKIELHHETWSLMCIGEESCWQNRKDIPPLEKSIGHFWPKMRSMTVFWKKSQILYDDIIFDMIEIHRPTVLIISYPTPYQEAFISSHWYRLKKAGVKVVIAGGEKVLFELRESISEESSFSWDRVKRFCQSMFSGRSLSIIHSWILSALFVTYCLYRQFVHALFHQVDHD